MINASTSQPNVLQRESHSLVNTACFAFRFRFRLEWTQCRITSTSAARTCTAPGSIKRRTTTNTSTTRNYRRRCAFHRRVRRQKWSPFCSTVSWMLILSLKINLRSRELSRTESPFPSILFIATRLQLMSRFLLTFQWPRLKRQRTLRFGHTVIRKIATT